MKWSYDKINNDYTYHSRLENFKIYFNLELKEEKTNICIAIGEVDKEESVLNYFNVMTTTSLKKEEIETLISDIEKEIKEKNISSFKELCILVLNKTIIN